MDMVYADAGKRINHVSVSTRRTISCVSRGRELEPLDEYGRGPVYKRCKASHLRTCTPVVASICRIRPQTTSHSRPDRHAPSDHLGYLLPAYPVAEADAAAGCEPLSRLVARASRHIVEQG